MRFKNAIDELAAAMGLQPVTTDDSGAFSLLFDDRYEVSFSPDDGDCTVVFHADIGDASALGGDEARALLEASLLGAKTGGAAFSIDPAAKRVVIWRRYGEFADCDDLKTALAGFLGQVVFWQERLASGQFAAADAAESPRMQLGSFINI